ncbi:MAG TPA: Tol-Pal system beta propeller repeat protein TolB [Thermoanaerobaculia bacterium]|nr:Tol-Pal system beta propeller repeat protein TolB [Thermoanaerobaculia bacterium]
MKTILATLLTFAAPSLLAQTDVTVTMDPSQAATIARIAVPFPDSIPRTAGSMVVTGDEIRLPFFAPLTRDIAYSDAFAIAPLPPGVAVTPDVARRAGAHYLLKLNVFREGEDYLIDAELFDASGTPHPGKRYRASAAALTRTAHTIADQVLRLVTGRPGIFMTQIAFSSDRSGHWEIWLMDWDGANQRQITNHRTLSILPSWAPDNERMVYTSFAGGRSDMWVINRRGGGQIRLSTGLALNTSASFSPVSDDVAFVGSVEGNPDIYLIRDNGTNVRRVTTSSSIESTPEWSPNGRHISFTSGRSGTPQIYIMDAEGTNVRRISFEGNWNDDATWSPDGERIAYTSRVAGRFQIRIHNTVTGETRIVAGDGSNEQPSWSPDGRWITFQSNRTGKWQVYRMRVDGTDLLQLTFHGENKNPDWSKKVE